MQLLLIIAQVSKNERGDGIGRGKVEPKRAEGLRMGAAAEPEKNRLIIVGLLG